MNQSYDKPSSSGSGQETNIPKPVSTKHKSPNKQRPHPKMMNPIEIEEQSFSEDFDQYSNSSMESIADNPSEVHRYRAQGDRVLSKFRGIIDKYDYHIGPDHPPIQTSPRKSKITDEEIEKKKELLERLDEVLLPELSLEIQGFSDLFEPSELHEAPYRQLKTIRRRQHELEKTIDRVLKAKREICRDACTTSEPNDPDLEEIKSYRLYILAYGFQVYLIPMICELFIKSYELIEEMAFSNDPPDHIMDVSTARGLMLDCTAEATTEIAAIRRFIQGSDMDNIQSRWSGLVPAIEETHKAYEDLIKKVQLHPVLCRSYTPVDPSIKVAKAFLPIMKLSRLFFKKLASDPKFSNNDKRLRKFTHLPSSQLSALGELPDVLDKVLAESHEHLENSSITEEGMTSWELSLLVDELQVGFRQSMIVVDYFISQIPDSDREGFPKQTRYREWFKLWNDTFSSSVSRLMQVVDPYLYEDCQCPNCLNPRPRRRQPR
ncbi:hypothetical protein PGT21_011274 [Puccinia graminis f. sp. tritici]|uniref:Uncharacterized protein n=2 Tax=Puccinia graminis f. sp. tritici TaxID=56615 RepID=A0A5B0M695_PUCGR|nr:hypothetical protein PGT21_011274 [Puccinia graminis f. sp. tritici]